MNPAPTLGVVTTDRHLAIRGWNDWIAQCTQLPEATVIGRSLIDFVAAERAPFYQDLLAEIIDTGSARVLAPAFHHYLIECAVRAPSAHFEHMQQRVTIAPLLADATVAGLMITIEDVTDRLDRERHAAAASHASPAAPPRTTALASEDWRVRGQAVRQLKQTASVDELKHLFDTLQRDHHDLNVLNSALRVLVAAGRTVVEPLVELLRDDAANLRMHAALALGELRAQEATPDLVTTLDDPDENVRFHAIEALGRIGAAESIDPLARIAASDNFFLAFAAIEALSKTDDARVAPLMVSLLDQDALRPAAIETLAAIGDEDCVPALSRSLAQPDTDAGAVASALLRIQQRYEDSLGAGSFIAESCVEAITPSGSRRLMELADKRGPDRAAVATVLGWLGKQALDPLLKMIGDEELQPAVADSIVRIGTDAVQPLIGKLADASPSTRAAAAELLGRIGDRRAGAPLMQALDDTNADVAAAAAAALGNVGEPAAVRALMSTFSHPSAPVRRAAIAAVNAIGAVETADLIRTALADPDARVRESAIRVAGYFGFAGTVRQIVAALKDPVEDVRRAAIEQMPVVDEVDAVQLLADAIAAEAPRNRAAAAHAMRLIDDPRAGAALRSALTDEDVWVRYFAATALADPRFGASSADALAGLARNDAATHVRIAALTSLGAIATDAAARVAAELIGEQDDLAIAAINVLGGIPGLTSHLQLARAARSSRPALQRAAIQAFAHRPGPDAIEVLSWTARAGDRTLAEDAIDALRRIAAAESPSAQRAAVAALRDLAAEGTRRLEAIAAIARLPEMAVPEVASGLSASRVCVRVATADALAAMRHPRASSELARALRDENPAVRSAAISGFAKLGTPSVGRTIAAMRSGDPDEGVRRRADLACARHGWGTGPSLRS
jgi:HEAT repeat protein